uniref:Uncharacterized protein n=1 Tax=Anguilla anguilla TaxID=7936 RepID=A0A0E9QB89_ANGAN
MLICLRGGHLPSLKARPCGLYHRLSRLVMNY